VHLVAIEGSKKVLGIHDPKKPVPMVSDALGLAAAAVSIIYYLAKIILLTVVNWSEH
jgi:hypothetical protein